MKCDDVRGLLAQDVLLRALVDSVPSMLAYWDAEQRCRFANRAYQRWFGLPPEALIGKHLREILGPVYAVHQERTEAVLRGEPQEFERELADPAGGPVRHNLVNLIPHVVDGVVCGFFVSVADITAIKRVQLALRESEERFRLTIDEAPIGMALVAMDGRFMRVNRVLCEIVGYTPDELRGMNFQAITHPDDLDGDLALVAKLTSGEIPRYTLDKRYVRKDGVIVDVMISVSLVRGSDGAPIHFISQIEDISARKQLEEWLRLAEATSSGILEISADAIVSVDEQQRITMFNAGAEKIFGYTRDEALGASLDILIPEALREVHRRHVEQFARGGTSARHMGKRGSYVAGRRRSGEVFPADAAISRLEVGGRRILTAALRDVTVQKRIEDEQRFLAEIGPVLATSLDYEDTIRRIAEVAVASFADLCTVDLLEDGEVRRVEVACRDPGRRWLCDLIRGLQIARDRPHMMRSVLETRRPLLMQRPTPEEIAAFAQSEEHLRVLQGAEISSLVAVPLLVRGKLLGALAFVSSTPERRYGPADVRLAEEIAQRAALSIENAQLFRAAQRATQARDDVLAVVAHDLRNPLASVLMHVASLRRDGDEARRQRSLAVIERAATRMDRLIGDLFDLTCMEKGQLSIEPGPVATRQLVLDAFEAHRPQAARASIELRLDLAPELPGVWADRDRVLQVFENLIANAIKFTGPGGRITLGAAPRGEEVLLWVADTGCGIPAEQLPHVFDRFWQATRAEGRGAGLGLCIVKGVVGAHGGRIWAESTPGEGSTFFFTIPTHERATRSPPGSCG